MIHTLGIAAQIPQCTWGIRHLDTAGFSEISLLGQIRQLAFVLALDTRTLGADGHYEAAFARCLTMRRLARHIGEDTMMAYLVSLSVDGLAQQTLQYVLCLLPPHADLLRGLRGQLAAVPGTSRSMEKAVQADFELVLERMRSDANLLEWIRQDLAKNAGDQQTKDRAPTLTDEDILALAREPYQRFLDGVFQVMDSDMPYEQKYTEIDNQTNRLADNYANDLGVLCVMLSGSANQIVHRYSLSVRNVAAYNALKTAVEVYLVRAQTGQLPKSVPEHAPKDPFSGQAFEYEITASGFILRCGAKDLYEDRVWQYEFKIPFGNPERS